MRSKARLHFSMVEILVVTAVIVILMGAVVGIADYVSRRNADARTRAVVEMLCSALEQYKEKYGFYPPTVNFQPDGYIRFHLDDYSPDATATSHPSRMNQNNFNQFIDYDHFIQAGRSKMEDGFYRILDGYGNDGYIYYRCPGYVNKTAYDLGSIGYDECVGDGNNTALTASGAKDHFGKGDDITNCRR